MFIGALPAAQLGQPNTDPVAAASAALRAGRPEEAHHLLAGPLNENTTDPRIWTLDGFALTRMGRNRDGLKSYQRALGLAPDYLPALEGAAETAFKARLPEAPELLRRVSTLQPGDETSHAMLATLAFEKGDCQTAEQEFERSQRVIQNQNASLTQRAACLVSLKRTAEGVEIFRALAAQAPNDKRAQYNLALAELQAGQPRQSIATLKAMPLSSQSAEMMDLLAEAYERSTDTPAAVATLREAIVNHPGDSRLYLHFANLCLAHTSFKAGVDMLDAGIARRPKDASLLLARGILLIQLARYADAQKDFDHAETLDPNARYAGALQGMAKLQENQLGAAATELRTRVRAHPKDAFLQYLLAETLARGGAVPGSADFSEALQAAKTAVALQPNFGLARDVLGRLYLQRGDITAAVRESRQAFEDDPTDQTALYHLILALKKAGKTNEIPTLTKKLASVRQAAQQKEINERRFAIVTGGKRTP